METVTLARNAMATRFEMVLHGANAARLRGAGEEAFAEVDRLESQLSLFKPSSEIARINARAADEPVRVSPAVFRLLDHARLLHKESDGAFDIAMAPLLRCWGFLNGTGAMPAPDELEWARRVAGMEHVILDEANSTVQFDCKGAMLDLGAIGKGYAIDRAAEILREAGVTSALLHGGSSTVCAIGRQPDGEPWKIAIESPPGINPEQTPAATVLLADETLSVSAVWGKCFVHEGKTFGHVIDPRLGRPVSNAVLAAVVLPLATETDALSTALLVLGTAGHQRIAGLRPGMKSLVIGPEAEGYPMESWGISLKTRGKN